MHSLQKVVEKWLKALFPCSPCFSRLGLRAREPVDQQIQFLMLYPMIYALLGVVDDKWRFFLVSSLQFILPHVREAGAFARLEN